MEEIKFSDDFYRIYKKSFKLKDFKKLLLDPGLRFLYFYRNYNKTNSKIKKILFKLILNNIRLKFGIEIYPETKIGKGCYIGHPFNITINPNSILGENINIHKGVTIGQENRGKRKGVPVIGNKVWIGVNSTIVGNIKIGNNVLIAPNSYVNKDIPNNSIVIGNPCKIIESKDATKNYINNIVE